MHIWRNVKNKYGVVCGWRGYLTYVWKLHLCLNVRKNAIIVPPGPVFFNLSNFKFVESIPRILGVEAPTWLSRGNINCHFWQHEFPV